MELNEARTVIGNLEQENQEIKSKIMNLNKELETQRTLVISLQEKREVSLHEIQRLSQEVTSLKSALNFSHMKKPSMGQISEGTPSLQKENSQMNYSQPHIGQNVVSPQIQNSSGLYGNKNNSGLKKKQEAKYLGMTKKEIEGVYREMIQGLLPLMQEGEMCKSFVKIEKKLNDAIRRAQDHIDTLEEV